MPNGVQFYPDATFGNSGGITVWEGIDPDSVYINAAVKNVTDVERSFDVAVEIDGDFVDLLGGTVGPGDEESVGDTYTDLGIPPGEQRDVQVCVQLVNISPV